MSLGEHYTITDINSLAKGSGKYFSSLEADKRNVLLAL